MKEHVIRNLFLAARLSLVVLCAIALETNSSRAVTTNDSSSSTSQTTIEYLFKALNNEATRPAAIDALVKTGSAAVEPLTNALRDVSPFIRAAAAEALGGIKDPRAIEPLSRTLSRDSYEYSRAHAAWALAVMADPKVIAPLIESLSDPHPDVRTAAELALAKLGPLSIEPLINVLNRRRSAAIRNSAIRALGGISDPRVVEPLISALDDAAVRDSAAIALGEIRDPRAIEPLIKAISDKDRPGGSYAAAALIKIGAPCVEPLSKVLKDSDPDIRRLTVIALGEIRDPKAIEALTERLEDETPEVRQAAQDAIEKIQQANPNRS